MNKAWERVRRFLQAGPAIMGRAAREGEILLELHRQGSAISVATDVLQDMASAGVLLREGRNVRLPGAEDGAPDGGDALGARPRILDVKPDAAGEALAVNVAESPLALLMRRRTKDGAPFISTGEFNAGERLRADYTRGLLMPRLGANWEAAVASGRRHGGGGAAEIGDAALAARLRVERALGAVGPELSGVLVDVCCFLKGLEQVESERGWPVRSAKIVLKSALAALARHYDPRSGKSARRGVLHWGAEDFRPKLS